MADKTLRKKGKNKRGQSPAEVDFISHLTVEECLEHLRSGRSPLKEYSLRIYDDGSHFQISAVTDNAKASYTQHMELDKRKLDSIGKPGFEGELEPVEAGTHVTGQVRKRPLPLRLSWEPVMIFACAVLAMVMGKIYISGSDVLWLVFAIILAVTVLVLIQAWLNDSEAYPNWLADYVRERLDVRRDHF